MTALAPEDVLAFWFEEIGPSAWWRPSKAFDHEIEHRFMDLLAAARRGDLAPWRATPEGRLAEILVLDQFSRHIFRDRAEAYDGDAFALSLARAAVEAGADVRLGARQRPFLYLPYVHSESVAAHEEALRLLGAPGLEASLASALKHKAVIDRFGRYPHRNRVLGRLSTPEEIAFLAREGRGF